MSATGLKPHNVNQLSEKLLSNELAFDRQVITDAINALIDALDENESGDKLFGVYSSFAELLQNQQAIMILDSLHHAFNSFLKGDLYDLYKYQQNEGWYPKVTLKEVLEPNDISSLGQAVVIYRGCDISEFQSNSYGQAWSTSIDVAAEFAYQHYASQNWFSSINRVVLKSKVATADIYFSNQRNHEREIVVNTAKLANVEICS